MQQKQYKILIIDDDDTIRESYAAKFRQEKFEVVTARDGLEGLDFVHKEKPDIIFTGIVMPKMTGFELIEALKRDVGTAEIPVVISSHLGRKEDVKKAKQLEVKDFIIQGEVALNEAVERIKSALGERLIYKIAIYKDKYDAKDLAKFLEKDPSFSCLTCGSEVFLTLEHVPGTEQFKVLMTCPSCQA